MQRKNQRNNLKKFSTATLVLALTCTGTQAAQCEFREQALGQYVVKTGDTLWDIASQFLKNPWCWPQVWDSNRDQIRDPHWIYPGQTVYFDPARGRLTLTGKGVNEQSDTTQTLRLKPHIRAVSLTPVATARALSLSSLRVQSVLVADGALVNAPSVVAIKDNRNMAGKHDVVLVRGELGLLTEFLVVRGGDRIVDPQTNTVLAYAVRQVGLISLLQSGGADGLHRFKVTTSDLELQLGDRLVPAMAAVDITPHTGSPLSGQLVSVLRGSLWASAYDVVAINRGKRHGLEAGSILAVMKGMKIGAHDAAVPVPSEQIATLLVFDVGDSVALASVMHASDTLSVGDTVGSGHVGGR